MRTTTEPPAAVVVNKSAVTSYDLTEPSVSDADDGLNDDDEEDEAFLGTLVGTGVASWYGGKFHGRLTASGERFNRMDLTAAHKSLPFGTRVCVRNVSTGKTVLVRINDRGPFAPGRVIDLSQAAAQELGIQGLGIKPVELYKMHGKDDTCPDELLTAGSRLDDTDGGGEANGTGKRMVLPANAVTPAALRSSPAALRSSPASLRSSRGAANKRDARQSATSDSRPTRKARPAKSPKR